MGRHPDPHRRRTVEDCAGRLTVRRYVLGKDRPADLGPVALVTTRPHFGGQRRWFACPGCDRRVAILYRPVPGAAWRCRACHRLSYRSAQQAHRAERAARGAEREARVWGGLFRVPRPPHVEAPDEAMTQAVAAAIAGGGGWDAILRELSRFGLPGLEDLLGEWHAAGDEAGPGHA
jgi:hypothetical protein